MNDRYENYDGKYMAQRIGVCKVFDKFFESEEFDIVIEIGYYKGGFTNYLSDKFGDKLHTFDINEMEDTKLQEKIESNGSHIYIEDVFTTDTLENLLQQGRVLLLCDGGDKAREVCVFKDFIKSSDIIMAHDYFKTKEEQRDEVWYSCETVAKDMDLKRLTHYQEWSKTFAPVVWGIRIKT